MTVGVPEISLDTWGLKYVKKKIQPQSTVAGGSATQGKDYLGKPESRSPAETKPDQFMRDDEAALSIPNTRQQDTGSDTTTRRGSTGGKTGEQVHQHQQDKTRLGGQQGETFATSGSKRGEGATDTPTRAGQALDDKGQVKHEQTHTGSEGRNLGDPSTDPKSRGGHKIKPAKQGEGSSKTPKGTMIQRASLDLAIIKCKLLKMNNVNKILPLLAAGALGAGAAGLAGGVKDAVEGDDEVDKASPTFTEDEKSKMTKEDLTRKREASRQDAEDKGVDHIYKEGDIVAKAIELINEAYDTMKSSVENSSSENEAGIDLKNVIEDLKETKKEGADGGTNTTSSEGGFNHVYSDVHEAKRQKQNQ